MRAEKVSLEANDAKAHSESFVCTPVLNQIHVRFHPNVQSRNVNPSGTVSPLSSFANRRGLSASRFLDYCGGGH